MLETMRSLKVDMDNIKDDNEKFLKAKTKQEEINEILLKSLAEKIRYRQVGHHSCSADKGNLESETLKRKECEDTRADSKSVELLGQHKKTKLASNSSTSKEFKTASKKCR
jgi:hypothetical protein